MVPYILEETETYAVVYKPPLMHTAPLGDAGVPGVQVTLLDWYAGRYPRVLDLKGKKKGEGGLLHRLDFATEGLVLFAKTQEGLESLYAQQLAGKLVKEYRALSCPAPVNLKGFPPPPAVLSGGEKAAGRRIESFFRPWGPGRKAVRPVVPDWQGKKGRMEIARDLGAPYRTEILSSGEFAGNVETLHVFSLRIARGFRHQIRCHLAWIGEPILNDTLYGAPGTALEGIALRAQALSFYDPPTGEQKNYCLPPLGFDEQVFPNF